MIDNNLFVLHKRLKEILGAYDSICKQLGLDYVLVEGSLLGAVRHKDIIPWDDDIDVAMTREDYEKLLKYFKKNKNGRYKLYCPETSGRCFQIFAKFVDTVDDCEEVKKYQTCRDGLSIDVFPLDRAYPSNKLSQIAVEVKIKLMRRVISSRIKLAEGKESRKKRICRFLFTLPFIAFSTKALYNYTVGLCKKRSSSDCPNLALYGSSYKTSKENYPKEKWLRSIHIQFGDDLRPVPAAYDEILKKVYGMDYMDMPPEHKRIRHTYVKPE